MGHTGGLGQRPPKTFEFTVTSGSGSKELLVGGSVIMYSIKAPSSTSQYDIEFTDSDAYGLAESLNLIGNNTISKEFQLHYDHKNSNGATVSITNASEDGSYSVRVWFKG